jgi:hypothetical protein
LTSIAGSRLVRRVAASAVHGYPCQGKIPNSVH